MPTAKAPGVIQKLTRCSAHLYLCVDDCFDDNTFRTLLAENNLFCCKSLRKIVEGNYYGST